MPRPKLKRPVRDFHLRLWADDYELLKAFANPNAIVRDLVSDWCTSVEAELRNDLKLNPENADVSRLRSLFSRLDAVRSNENA